MWNICWFFSYSSQSRFLLSRCESEYNVFNFNRILLECYLLASENCFSFIAFVSLSIVISCQRYPLALFAFYPSFVLLHLFLIKISFSISRFEFFLLKMLRLLFKSKWKSCCNRILLLEMNEKMKKEFLLDWPPFSFQNI